MRIGSSLPYLPSPVSDRGHAAPRAPQVEPESGGESASRGEVTRVRSRAGNSGDFASTLSDRSLPQRARDALQSYLANGPSLSERLGVELAGIDVLV